MASQQRVPVACTVARVRKGAGSRLPFKGRSGWLTSRRLELRCEAGGRTRPLRTWRHVLGAGNAPCRDKELRQWMPCVTFSASPRTVTHASRRCALAQSVSSAGGRTWEDRRRDAAAAGVGSSERKDGRQRPNDESRTTALASCAALPGLKAAWVSMHMQTGTTPRMQRAQTLFKVKAQRADFIVHRAPQKSAPRSGSTSFFETLRNCRHKCVASRPS